ncbi:MAG: hypothetical protein ACXWJD_10015, partial [Burkholderiaceae bacterium]
DEKIAQKQLAQGKKVAAPEGFGESPEVKAQLDKLYRAVYGRAADRFEKVAFVNYLEEQKKKLVKSTDDDTDADNSAALSNDKKADKAEKAKAGRAAAFVNLVHAVANSNEFSYRF